MKKISDVYLYFSTIVCFLLTSGCVSTGPSVLKLNYKPSESIKSSDLQAQKIKLVSFQDARDEKDKPEIIGHREAAFGTSMGDVKVEKPISVTIYDAFSYELMQNGFKLVNTGEDLTITGKILMFRVGTDVTNLYWDVYGEVKIEIEIKNTKSESTKVGPYSARNVERTYTNPGVAIMERVLLASIKDVIKKILSDKDFVK